MYGSTQFHCWHEIFNNRKIAVLDLLQHDATERITRKLFADFFSRSSVETVALFKSKWIYMPISCCYDL